MSGKTEDFLFRNYYPGLDLIRVMAITMVLMRHVTDRIFYQLPHGSYLKTFFLWSSSGVTFFFALSGFLIGGQIIEAVSAGRFSFKTFYLKRLWRIAPPYVVAVMVVFTIYIYRYSGYSFQTLLSSFMQYMFYLQNYTSPAIKIHAYWSLAVEEQFYIIAPLLLFLLVRYARRFLPAALIILIAATIAGRFAIYIYNPVVRWDTNTWVAQVAHPFHTRCDALLFGILAAYIFIKYRDRLMGSFPLRALILFISLAGLGISLKYGSDGPGYFNTSWKFTLTGLGFSALTLWFTVTPLASYIRPKKAVAFIAKISYPMYLYHLTLMLPMVYLTNRFLSFDRGSFTDFFIIFAIFYLLVIIVSSITYFLIDKPCMNFRKRYTAQEKE